MIVGRVIAWSLAMVGLVALVADIARSLDAGRLIITPLGADWYALDRASLGLLQAGIQRYVWPYLWDPVITEVLVRPTWLAFGALGGLVWLIVVLIARRRRRRASS
ncbi:MAG: hypothetical protein FJX56_06930 [Alphaproteobacteria bacterium]|nr:hypothetical protein [Alphaproteobacteria bacterium]